MKSESGAILSIITYVILASLKITFGLLGNSSALFADGLNSFSDIFVSLIILVGLIISKRPKDSNHPFGHHRFEQITTIVAAFLMTIVGINVIREGITKVAVKSSERPDIYTAYVAFGAGLTIALVGLYNYRLAKKVNSSTLKAVSKDNFSDSLVSFGAGIGIVAAVFSISWIDPAVSIVIGLIIIKTAWGIFIESTNKLVDTFDPKLAERYKEKINEVIGVINVLAIRGRTYGHQQDLEIIITVDKNKSVFEAHEICDEVEKILNQQFSDIRDIMVHVEPDN